MSKSAPVKVSAETHKLLKQLQDTLPGKPSFISLLDEGVKLLAEKYLKREGKNADS